MKHSKILSLLLLFCGISFAQLRINEVMVSNLTGTSDYYGQKSDWVELYNAGTLPININGYYLTNDKTNLYKWALPNITIKVDSFLVVWCTSRNLKDPSGQYHTNFTIEQCKNQWLILSLNGVVKDSLFIRRTQQNHSRGKYPDGSLGYKLFTTPTFSATNSAINYVDYCPTPTFSQSPGFSNPSQVDINVPDTSKFAILYTQDGSTPIPGAAPNYTTGIGPTTSVYTLGITMLNPGITTIYRAMAVPINSYSTAYQPSFIETNTYFIGESIDPNFGVVSLSMDTNFFNTAASQTIHVEYYDKQKFISEGYTTVKKPINDAWINKQRGTDLIFVDEYGGGCALTGQIFNNAYLGVSTRTFFPRIELKCETKDNFSPVPSSTVIAPGAHMRDMFAQSYAMKNSYNLDEMHFKPVVTFVNGTYKGIYEFSELPDDNYTEFYKNINKDSVDILAQHTANIIAFGSDTGWVTPSNNNGISKYIKAFPMNSTLFYQRATTRLDTNSIIDFMIYNNYLVNIDLMNENNAWWRGRSGTNVNLTKWRYFTWNMPNIYSLCMPTTSSPTNCAMSASTCEYNKFYNSSSNAYQSHSYLLQRLMMNQNFKTTYLNRYMDLLNSSLKCTNLLNHYTYIYNLLSTEMNHHTSVWGVNYSDWQTNADTLKVRIQNRCDYIEKTFKTCYSMTGPYNITVDVRPVGSGYVNLNSLFLTSFIWAGNYYVSSPPSKMFFKATPSDTNYVFDHWEFQNPNHVPFNKRHDTTSIRFSGADNVVAVFYDKRTDAMFPTGFTPNSDGMNDFFGPVNPNYLKTFEMRIYDRWGEEIFYSTDASNGWDGTFNGKSVSPGVYAYVARYKNIINEEKVIKGNITLIR